MFKNRKCRSALISIVCCFFLVGLSLADDVRRVEIPAGDLIVALQSLAKQTGIELVYQSEVIKGIKTKGVSGALSPVDALTKLLEGTGLKLNTDSTGAMLIAAPQAARGSSNRVAPSFGDVGSTTRLAQSNTANAQSPSDNSQTNQNVPSSNSKDSASKQSSEDSKGLAEILVKGSRIMNVDVTRTEDDPQPYYIFDSQTIEQSGATDVSDFLKQRLTMNTVFALNAQSAGNPRGNTSAINLRGLGTSETLVLVDGRRSAGVTAGQLAGQPDINGLPLAAIERIEVLPSSASAIYGGAAVGGVVNIILKKNFSGGDIRYSYENVTAGSAPIKTLSATYGFSLHDGTQVMISGHYSDGTGLPRQDRLDLFQRGISNILRNNPSSLYSPASPFPGATPNIASASYDSNGNLLPLTLRNGTPLNSPITSIPAGTAPGSDLTAGLLANAGKYNLNLAPGTGQDGLQQLLTQVPREKSLLVTLRRELTSTFSVFSDFSTATNFSTGLLSPFGTSYIPAASAIDPFAQAVLVKFPNSPSTQYINNSVTQRATVGMLASLAGNWKSELDYTWSRNLFSTSHYAADNAAANAAIATGALNPFVDTAAYPLDLTPYLYQMSEGNEATLDDVALRASGPLGSLFGVQPTLTIGLEHRKEGFHDGHILDSYPYDSKNNSDTLIFGQSQSTDSIYAEALFPLVAPGNAVPWIHSLDLQLAGRSERYTDQVGTPFKTVFPVIDQQYDPPQGVHATVKYTSTNPTIAVKFVPVEELTFRASFAKAFLPPTAIQLLPNLIPACGYACQTITDPKNGQTYDVDITSGGNPSLNPQTSRDWDLGIIWEPKWSFLNGLRLNLQHYEIDQPNYITVPTVQQAADDPSRLTRDPTTGRITLVNDSYINATLYKTKGWDSTIDYARSTALGTFSLHTGATVIEHDYRQTGIGDPLLDYVGFPSEGGEAKLKANATFGWEYRHWNVSWQTSYIGSYQQTGAPGDPYGITTYYTASQGGYTIPSQTYHTLFVSYGFVQAPVELLSNLTIQAGVKNIFNALPPFDAYPNNPSFYSTYGDPRLRDFWVSVRKAF